ncbi:Uncharacterised protein [uncultured archaeon]|nr:Uncharacterised protein [uncultured archaeon]
MNSITETCIVSASKDKVFQFLSDIENLPKWSTQFVKKLVVVNGKYKAITPIGEVFLKLETDQKAGLIDIYAGPTEKHMTPAFLRVISFSNNSTAIMFTFFQYSDTDEKTWKIFCEWIKIEVGNIKKHFS